MKHPERLGVLHPPVLNEIVPVPILKRLERQIRQCPIRYDDQLLSSPKRVLERFNDQGVKLPTEDAAPFSRKQLTSGRRRQVVAVEPDEA